MKNERGLTLVELLAVIVILSIISAIAIPAIGQVINNTKADTHLANARQVLRAGQMAYASGDMPDGIWYVTAKVYYMEELVDGGYLNGKIKNPSIMSSWEAENSTYDLKESMVRVDTDANGQMVFKVHLSIGGGNYIFNGFQTSEQLSRDVFTEDMKKALSLPPY